MRRHVSCPRRHFCTPTGARTASVRGTGAFSGRSMSSQRESFSAAQDTLTTIAEDTGGKAFLDAGTGRFSGLGRLLPEAVKVDVTRDYGETATEKANELILHLLLGHYPGERHC